MIKYSLVCKDCDLIFESWFASSQEYEKLKKRNFLNCLICNSMNIEKSLMSPSLIHKKSDTQTSKKLNKHNRIKKKISEYQKFIKKNFVCVGDNFAYEARSIHYNPKKKEKSIYGTASKQDIKELKEEGIDTHTIPWVEDKNN